MIPWLEIRTAAGTVVRGCRWEIDAPTAVVVLVTGMLETLERYDPFARYLNTLGCSVYGLDHFGQGRNCSTLDELGVWPADGFAQSIEVIHREVQQVRREGVPLYLFAHSMGSYITQGYLQRYSETLDRVVLCGSAGKRAIVPAAAVFGAARVRLLGPTHRDPTMHRLMFGNYCRRITQPCTENDWLSANPANVAAYTEDPKCGYIATTGFYTGFLQGLAGLYRPEGLRRISPSLPILLISGAEDPATEYGNGTKKLKAMYDRYHLNVRLTLYPGLRHELLNECACEQIYSDIARFFRLC